MTDAKYIGKHKSYIRSDVNGVTNRYVIGETAVEVYFSTIKSAASTTVMKLLDKLMARFMRKKNSHANQILDEIDEQIRLRLKKYYKVLWRP